MELNPEIVEGKYYLIQGREGSYVVPESEIGTIPTGDREDLLNSLSDEDIAELEEQLNNYTGFRSLSQVRRISRRKGVVGRLVTDWVAGPQEGSSFESEEDATIFLEQIIDYNQDEFEDEYEEPAKNVGLHKSGALTEEKLLNDERAILVKEMVPRQHYKVNYGDMELAETDTMRQALDEARIFMRASSNIKDPRIYLITKSGIERIN